MAIFIPLLLFAGAATISLFVDGCAPPAPPQAPPKPVEPPPPPLPYAALLGDLERQILQTGSGSLKRSDFVLPEWLSDARQADKARDFVTHLGGHDERPQDLSLYDLYFEIQHHFGEEEKGEWRDLFLGSDFKLSPQERIRLIGEAARGSTSAKPAPARELLQALALYVGLLSPSQPEKRLETTFNFYLNGAEPPLFSKYLKSSFSDFIKMNPEQKKKSFRAALSAGIPDAATAQGLIESLSPDEAQLFLRESLRRDPKAALDLFEKIKLPAGELDATRSSDESEFFPNLPQDHPFAKRQQAIDAFLPAPEKVLKRGGVLLKKYRWVEDTELFSLESGKPGPTTLVFAPHFEEPNPRKVLHWLKDLPLQSGRVILIPEANRAMGLSHRDTRAMNNLFNRAFLSDRSDYLVVRRTEYLMGLCDGMIGLHDWVKHEPFFISDAIVDPDGKAELKVGPVASPWLAPEVRKIRRFSPGMTLDPPGDPTTMEQRVQRAFEGGLQVPWQIAEDAAARLEKLSGRRFERSATLIADRDSYRIDNATAYMNYFLKKPAMTYEGTTELAQGQLTAQATYALLRSFGHKIDAKFEAKLKDPNPSLEPELYLGLPPP